jgi:hypothetical protein
MPCYTDGVTGIEMKLTKFFKRFEDKEKKKDDDVLMFVFVLVSVSVCRQPLL